MKMSLDKLLFDLNRTNINILQIENEYLKMLKTLPWIHKDPFDRLLISTALVEGLTFITADENIQKYDITCVW